MPLLSYTELLVLVDSEGEYMPPTLLLVVLYTLEALCNGDVMS